MRPRPGSSARPARPATARRPRATISAAGTTSSSCQPLLVPTSMYSMKRRMVPVPRNRSAMSAIESSLTPRWTTMFTLTGRPAAAAASMPSSTRCTGKRTSFIRWNTSSSSESRLTVIRSRPAARSAVRLAGQHRAVGGQRQVAQAVLAEAVEHADQRLDVAPQERLAAGHAELLDAAADEDPRHPRDLLERQQLGAVEELVAVPEHLARHAVGAAEVAAIGDRDPQIPERPCESVADGVHLYSKGTGDRFGPARGVRRAAASAAPAAGRRAGDDDPVAEHQRHEHGAVVRRAAGGVPGVGGRAGRGRGRPGRRAALRRAGEPEGAAHPGGAADAGRRAARLRPAMAGRRARGGGAGVADRAARRRAEDRGLRAALLPGRAGDARRHARPPRLPPPGADRRPRSPPTPPTRSSPR